MPILQRFPMIPIITITGVIIIQLNFLVIQLMVIPVQELALSVLTAMLSLPGIKVRVMVQPIL
jgi:hypothetical protein